MRALTTVMLTWIVFAFTDCGEQKNTSYISILEQHELYKENMSALDLNSAGYTLYKQEFFTEAAILFREAVKKDPNLDVAHYNLACMLALDYGIESKKDIDTDEIFFHLKTAVKLNPDRLYKIPEDSDLESIRELPEYQEMIQDITSVDEEFKILALKVLTAIKEKDMERLAIICHPYKGILFSTDTRIEETDVIIKKTIDVKRFFGDNRTFIWGKYSWDGKDIKLTKKEFWDRYVYDEDYLHADKIGYNRIIRKEGHFKNIKNNIQQAFPGASVVEYYIKGERLDIGLHWSSLRLVFQDLDGTLYLVAIVHDQF